jgi:hypothetical protein
MTTFHNTSVYYMATFAINDAHDFTGSGTTAGGLSPLTSRQLHDSVVLTGTVDEPSMSDGDQILLNGAVIGPFTSGDNMDDIVGRFNAMQLRTGVMASVNWDTYLTLQSINPAQATISLANISGTPLASLGLPSGGFDLYGPIYGGTVTALHNGHTAVINGVTVTFTTGGGLDLAGAVRTINAYTVNTDVVATPWTNKIQLNSKSGQPISFGTGTGTATSNIGFTSSTVYSGPMTLAKAIVIEQGNLRWNGVMNHISSVFTPTTYGPITLTGSTTDGNSPPDTVQWMIGTEHADQVSTVTLVGEPEGAGYTLYGPVAIKRLISRALTVGYSSNRNVQNTATSVLGGIAYSNNPVIVTRVTADPFSTSIANLEDSITVVQVS